MSKRIIGIDLAVTGEHKAVVLDQATNTYVTPVMAFRTDPADMDRLVACACQDAGEKPVLVAVLEATSTAWVPVSRYLQDKGVVVYRVNGQQVKDMRRVYQRHAKSDSIDVRVLARLPLLHPNRLQPLDLPSGDHMALQRACRELDRLRRTSTAIKNRLRSYDHLAGRRPGAPCPCCRHHLVAPALVPPLAGRGCRRSQAPHPVGRGFPRPTSRHQLDP